MTLCKHDPHKVIDQVLEPKYSTNQILISTDRISPNIDHYIIQFSKDAPKQKYGWFYLDGKTIRNSPTQPNGRGQVYAVDLNKRQDFIPKKECNHVD